MGSDERPDLGQVCPALDMETELGLPTHVAATVRVRECVRVVGEASRKTSNEGLSRGEAGQLLDGPSRLR